ncbi:MAG: BsuPI-related putative proteinase inhibitor [Armatimonadota bacterium]
MKRFYVLLVVCLVAAIAAPLYSQFSSLTSNGLMMSFNTSQERYEVTEPVDLQMVLVNKYHAALQYEFVNTPVCDFWITTSSGKEIWRYSTSRSFNGKTEVKLEPGESKICRVTWRQTDNYGRQVEPGWYEVYAKFSRADRDVEPFHTKIKIDENSGTSSVTVVIPLTTDKIDPVSDVGKNVTVNGTLRRNNQGLYIEVSDIRVKR